MPQVPTISTERPAGVLRLPQRVPVPDYSGAAQVGVRFGRFGEQLTQIGQRLRDLQNKLDTADLIGQYEGRVQEFSAEVRTSVEDPLEWSKEFSKKIKNFESTLLTQAKNTEVSAAVRQHISRNLPTTIYKVHAGGLEHMIKKQMAALYESRDAISRAAALEESPEEREEWDKMYKGLVDTAEKDGILDPVEAQKERERYREKSALDQMEVLRTTNPDKLFELDAQGAFTAVDPVKRAAIMDRTARERDARLVKAQAELDKATKVWVESIERETEAHIAKRTLTQEWIEEYRYAFTGEKLAAYGVALRNQTLGIKGGDPNVEARFLPYVTDPREDPRKALDRLTSLFARGLVGYDFYGTHAPYLRAKIDQARTERRTEENEQATRERELVRARSGAVLENANIAFKTVGILDLDSIASEALVQYRQEFISRERSYGGAEDAVALERELLPKYIVQVETRAESRVRMREELLGPIKDIASLKAAQSTMSPTEYERKALMLRELYKIRDERTRLMTIRNAVEGKKSPETKGRGQ